MTSLKLIELAKGFALNGFGLVFYFALNVYLARTLGPEQYGGFVYVTTIILFLSGVVDFGFSAISTRYIAVWLGQGEFGNVRYLFWFGMLALLALASMLSIFVGFFLYRLLGLRLGGIDEQTFLVLVIFFPVFVVHRWLAAVLKGLGKNTGQIFLENNALQGLLLVLVYIAWRGTNRLDMIILAFCASYAFIAFLELSLVMAVLREVPKLKAGNARSKRVVLDGLPLSLSSFGGKIFSRVDIILIGSIMGDSGVGLYKAAFMLVNGAKRLVAPVNNYSQFHLAKYFGQKNIVALTNYFDLAQLLSLSISSAVFLVLIHYAPIILSNVYGDKYTTVDSVISVLVLGFVFLVATGPIGALLKTYRKVWLRAWALLLASVANGVLNVILVPKIGLIGAAAATSVGFLFYFLFLNFVLRFYSIRCGSVKTPVYFLSLIALNVFFIEAVPVSQSIGNFGFSISIVLVIAYFVVEARRLKKMETAE